MSILDIARQHLADCIEDVEADREAIADAEAELALLRDHLVESEEAEAQARAAIALLTGGAS